MNFYEFKGFEYYALILAKTEQDALLGYEENIGEISEEDKELKPMTITIDQALELFIEAIIDEHISAEEIKKGFYKGINEFTNCYNPENYLLLLIDRDLC